MFQRLKRKLDNYQTCDLDDVYKKLEKYEYISFDIFDTLIKRDVSTPIDVFRVIEKKLDCKGFASARIEAERLAREKSSNNDVTLSEIYSCFDSNVFNENDIDYLINEEIETEKNLCTANVEMKAIYDWGLSNGKKVVIISDMYLDYNTISAILNENGFGDFYKLYISNIYNATKQQGSLYSFVCNDLHIDASKLVHIGNSFKADYLSAIKMGCGAIKIKTYENRLYFKTKIPSNSNGYWDKNQLNSYLNNHTKKVDFFYDFGYEAFGPALVGFAKWLLVNAQNDNRELILFLGRDGLIMKEVYDLLGFNKVIPSDYIEVSRRCFRIPSFDKLLDFMEIFPLLPLRKITTIRECFDCLGLNCDSYQDVLFALELNPDDTYVREELKSNVKMKELYENIQPDIVKNATQEKTALLKYLKMYDFNKPLAIVDVGWGGTIQGYLETILKEQGNNTDFCGYYLGVAKRAKKILKENQSKVKGYFYDCFNGPDVQDKHRPFDGLIETFFLQQVGSVKRFRVEDNIVTIERLPYEYEKDPLSREIVKQIQCGGLAFSKDYSASVLCDVLDYKSEVMFSNLYRAGTKPSREELKQFGNMSFYDSGNCNKLFDNYNFPYVVFHPKKFMLGYFNAYWKIGYLKNIFIIPLPYSCIVLNLFSKIKKMINGEADDC